MDSLCTGAALTVAQHLDEMAEATLCIEGERSLAVRRKEQIVGQLHHTSWTTLYHLSICDALPAFRPYFVRVTTPLKESLALDHEEAD
jgi:hypothetical protein